jgi:hypothetical protein
MKTYELIQSEEGSVVKATEGEKETWIPLDPANSDYAEYLRFTEWVEAGNDPNEFWTQNSDFDTLEETTGETND